MPVSVENMLSADGAIARRLEAYESRPQQVEMAVAVERAMDDRGHLLVEAGTGVGKSFAYLLPAIKRIVEHRERVIVATNTINLQEQLMDKDIPLLNAVIPDEFSAVLVKGRGNYLSLRRLKLASERQDRLFGDDDSRHTLHAIEDWAYGTRDGTLATLPVLQRMSVWDQVQSDSHNCMGRKCPTYDKCFYQSARRRMENGDLLVCNHALFFADLALRGEGVGFLPPYHHVIIDEAHGAEDVAADHFGTSISAARVTHLLRQLYHDRQHRGFLDGVRLKDRTTQRVDQAIEQTLRCYTAAENLFTDLLEWQGRGGRDNGRIDEADIVVNQLSDEMKSLSDQLKILRERVSTEADAYELNSYAQRSGDIATDAKLLLGQQVDGCVYWLEGTGPPPPGRSARVRLPAWRRVGLHCRAIEVAGILRERLFGQDVSVTMTSATLATGPNDFTHIAARLGSDNAQSLQLGSPFDHARQMEVMIDRTMTDPRHRDYVDALWPRIEHHIRETDGGVFVLFTSFDMIRRVATMLKPRLTRSGFPVLVQGQDGPPSLLLKRFRQDERSVLLGTSSFWQGVDVRGRGLRNVIITRLPFDVPDQPLIEARLEKIQERGGNPFMEEQVPKAVIRFKQGIGRLIRSSEDRGRIVVLDPRIVTKPYGRRFLGALPEGVEPQPAELPEGLFDDT